MSVVRRGAGVAVVAGIVLLGGPAWAQEDPCASGPDGSVPEMCQSGMPVSDTGTVGMEPDPACTALPFEPGDGVVTDGGDQGVALGEPEPGAPPSDVQEEPGSDERVDPEQGDPATDGDPATSEDPIGFVCTYAAVPGLDTGTPETAAGGGTATEQLPRTGPYDRLLALTAVGSGFVVAGVGAAAAGRRRRTA